MGYALNYLYLLFLYLIVITKLFKLLKYRVLTMFKENLNVKKRKKRNR